MNTPVESNTVLSTSNNLETKSTNPETTSVDTTSATNNRESWILVAGGGCAAIAFVLLLLVYKQSQQPTITPSLQFTPASNQSASLSGDITPTSEQVGYRDETDYLLSQVASSAARQANRLDDPDLDRYASLSEEANQSASSGEITRANRWKIVFSEGITQREYARQLQVLGIELGVLADDGTVQYVSNLTQEKPSTRSGSPDAENRLYFSWSRGDLADADSEMIANADIAAAGKIVLHFYSAELEDRLAELEKGFKGRTPNEIFLTRFGVRATMQNVEFYVLEQIPRE